jgi:hypothetical protein
VKPICQVLSLSLAWLVNAADLMLAPGIIFKTDIRERACQRHKREYGAALPIIGDCQQ